MLQKESPSRGVFHTTALRLSQHYQPPCHRPASVLLRHVINPECLCNWHAQMINLWQRELIKEIELGTQ